jgi:superoxide dismutase, Fe-Mn family
MKRKIVLIVLGVIIINTLSITTIAQNNNAVKHEFPALPYEFNALEPYIDAKTMELHYSKHHKGYYDNFLKALAGTEWENKSLEEIFNLMDSAPVALRNMGGGYYNHILFWANLTPKKTEMSQELQLAIVNKFGSFEDFKDQLNKAALTVFGSGWAWLIVTDKGDLEIVATVNQDNPLMNTVLKRGVPILGIDVWEHAYYLKYQNRRAEYISAFWNIINWEDVSQRYATLKNN